MAAQALMATVDENVKSISICPDRPDSAKIVHEVQYWTEVAICYAYRLLPTGMQPASL
jgi:hypothetical protein